MMTHESFILQFIAKDAQQTQNLGTEKWNNILAPLYDRLRAVACEYDEKAALTGQTALEFPRPFRREEATPRVKKERKATDSVS